MGEQVAARPFGGIAQLGEHLPCKQGVKGSNPFISTKAMKRASRWLRQTRREECLHSERSVWRRQGGHSKNARDEAGLACESAKAKPEVAFTDATS